MTVIKEGPNEGYDLPDGQYVFKMVQAGGFIQLQVALGPHAGIVAEQIRGKITGVEGSMTEEEEKPIADGVRVCPVCKRTTHCFVHQSGWCAACLHLWGKVVGLPSRGSTIHDPIASARNMLAVRWELRRQFALALSSLEASLDFRGSELVSEADDRVQAVLTAESADMEAHLEFVKAWMEGARERRKQRQA